MTKGPWAYVAGLLELGSLESAEERRAIWRQSMATLARAGAEEGPSPLEGLHPDALVAGVRAAAQAGLLDDLEWLAPAAAGVALYALASALPVGMDQRDIGRRVLARLNVADAETFCAMATRMALGGGKGLSSAPLRARVALVLDLPIGAQVADGPLALALCSARELSREWVSIPSTGSLAMRRLAARILERAAREASKRAQQGDNHAMRVFRGDTIRDAWRRLLNDRESLVWRHVAVARGLIAPWNPRMQVDVESALDVELSVTEWRRGATSLAAMVAVAPEASLRMAAGALSTGLLERDKGTAAAFVWGLARAAEAETQAATQLLEMVLPRAPFEAAEAVTELAVDYGPGPFTEKSARAALATLKASGAGRPDSDDGQASLLREVQRELGREPRSDPAVRDQIANALAAFVSSGAKAAFDIARTIVPSVAGQLDTLDALAQDEEEDAAGRGGTVARRTSLAVTRDLDSALLERQTLADLLKLGGADASRGHESDLDRMRERLATWILSREEASSTHPEDLRARPPRHLTLRLRRLRALVHLVDGDVALDDAPRAAHLRKRWAGIAASILDRFESGPPPQLRRSLFAALARTLDALVRADALDVADVVLVAVEFFRDPEDLKTLAEATMDPDQVHALGRAALFVEAVKKPLQVVPAPPSSDDDVVSVKPAPTDPVSAQLGALEELAREMFAHSTSRGEALRTALVRLASALRAVECATSLRGLVGASSDSNVVMMLENALSGVAQLARGARGRLDPERVTAGAHAGGGSVGGATNARLDSAGEVGLSVVVSRVVAGSELGLDPAALDGSIRELTADVPSPLAEVVAGTLNRLLSLPTERASHVPSVVRVALEPLPAWVPPRRTLGGFYLVRPLGNGASGSVFLARRVEDKNEDDAENFALKVPDFSATAARILSEAEFLQMFRAEASALIAVPTHPNLARFVTFDLAARPKPILVMELVEGPTLEQVVESGGLHLGSCFELLDDVLVGLQTMHEVGVGHLDLKPSNIILRNAQKAVLVDFGLAGRKIRPGCATLQYGAPEIWGALAEGSEATPQAADVYAFGCVAFEAFTGQPLFTGDSEMTMITTHIAHDGFPGRLKTMGSRVGLAPLAEILFWTLRRDPMMRPSVPQLRQDLARARAQLERLKWPLPV